MLHASTLPVELNPHSKRRGYGGTPKRGKAVPWTAVPGDQQIDFDRDSNVSDQAPK